MSTAWESVLYFKCTSVVGARNGSKPFLPGGVPNLQLAYLIVDFKHPEPEIHADCCKVVFNKVIIAEPEEEGRLADSLVADKDDLENVVLFLDHLWACLASYLKKFLYNLSIDLIQMMSKPFL